MKYIKWLAILVVSVMALSAVVLIGFPNASSYFHGEGTAVENLTALFYLLAGILAAFNATRISAMRPLSIVIALLSLAAFLDEVSFGQFYLNYRPLMIGDKNIDAIHDLFGLAGKFILHGLKDDTLPTLALVGTVGVLALAILFLFRAPLGRWIRTYLHTPAFILLVCCAGLLFTAEAIDILLSKFESLKMLEELFELCAATAILLSAFSVGRDKAVQA
jgi:hypothetical protein